jgi:hypothetical protein
MTSVSRTFTINVVAAPTGVPAFAQGMSDFQVRNMTGAYTPTNGKETMYSTLPAAWQQTGQPNGADMVFTAWCGGKGDVEGKRLFVHGGGHLDSSNNGLQRHECSGWVEHRGKYPYDLTANSDCLRND